MHNKVAIYLESLKEEVKKECKKCNQIGCMYCSAKYDLYEKLAAAKVPIKYWKFKLTDMNDDFIGVDKAKMYISKLDEAYKDGQGIFIYGGNGNGKTLCATIIAKEALKRNYTVRFAFLGEIISAFIDTMYDKDLRNELQKDILGVDFLIIDDVDKAYIKESKYIDATLDTLFRTRVQNSLPVIMTANKSLEEVLDLQEEVFSKSLLSLFNESLLPIVFMGCDYRNELKEQARKKYFGE